MGTGFSDRIGIAPTELELVALLGSNLFEHDDYIKSYLQDPEIPLLTKIGLRFYVMPDLILQFEILKDHLGIQSYKELAAKFL